MTDTDIAEKRAGLICTVQTSIYVCITNASLRTNIHSAQFAPVSRATDQRTRADRHVVHIALLSPRPCYAMLCYVSYVRGGGIAAPGPSWDRLHVARYHSGVFIYVCVVCVTSTFFLFLQELPAVEDARSEASEWELREQEEKGGGGPSRAGGS